MDIASGLLAYRADPNAESRAGFTPLHLVFNVILNIMIHNLLIKASEEGHQEMGALLIEHGSHVNSFSINPCILILIIFIPGECSSQKRFDAVAFVCPRGPSECGC